jgi:hypothetical protein
MKTPQIAIFSGSQFVQRGKKFAIKSADAVAGQMQPPTY